MWIWEDVFSPKALPVCSQRHVLRWALWTTPAFVLCKSSFECSRFSLSAWWRTSCFRNVCWSYPLSYRKCILAWPTEIHSASETSRHCFCGSLKRKVWCLVLEMSKPFDPHKSVATKMCIPFLFQSFLRIWKNGKISPNSSSYQTRKLQQIWRWTSMKSYRKF